MSTNNSASATTIKGAAMDTNLAKLEPHVVWNYFAEICKIPRPSKKEEQILVYLIQVAKDLRLDYQVTAIGNIIIQKVATVGMEDCKKITLQCHMDMVTSKLATSTHNFDTDPILAHIDGEWVRANGTTLGADNGIGIAFGLAVLAANNIAHGPLELLITTDEEMGMSGAFALESHEITGDILLNLDSEEDHEVCIGCAGGVDTNIMIPLSQVSYNQENKQAFKISLGNLFSGHSGVDIHLGRANAIKEIANLLYLLDKKYSIEMSHISGGKLRNVIPSYCEVVILVNMSDIGMVKASVVEFEQSLKIEFKQTDPKLQLSISSVDLPATIFENVQCKRFILALKTCFNGLYRMNWDLNIPYTSSNIGVVKMLPDNLGNPENPNNGGGILINTLQRSPDANAKHKLAATVAAPFDLIDATIEYSSGYPGWQPNLSSEMLGVVTSCYKNLFGEEIRVSATHGGLECGLILGKLPHMDSVSIGSTIRDAHSPNERLKIDSVAKTWKLLQEILKDVPRKIIN